MGNEEMMLGEMSKKVYALVDESYRITDITFEENDYLLSEISSDTTLEEYKQELDLENSKMVYAIEGVTYNIEDDGNKKVVTMDEMKEEIALVTAELMNTMIEMIGGGDIDEGA